MYRFYIDERMCSISEGMKYLGNTHKDLYTTLIAVQVQRITYVSIACYLLLIGSSSCSLFFLVTPHVLLRTQIHIRITNMAKREPGMKETKKGAVNWLAC